MLLKSTMKVQVVLAGAITTSQLPVIAAWADMLADASTLAPDASTTATNSTTAVDVVAAPASGSKRQLKYLSIYNADTVTATATVRVDDSGTARIIVKVPLLTGERLEYTPSVGFTKVTAAGTTAAVAWGGITGTLASQTDLQAALDLKANLASPPLTGNPTAPTQAAGDSSTKLATTAFVNTISEQTVASAATVTPTFANDLVTVTAQAAALALANPTGTAQNGWGIGIRIKDNGTARAISYGTQYRAVGVTLPTTTVINKTLYLGCIWNAADTKLDVVSVAQEA